MYDGWFEAWLKNGYYLPEILQDFHDAKDIFKTMHRLHIVEANGFYHHPNAMDGQIYVIDHFLYFMAKRGYTLQKSRKHFNFKDINIDINLVKQIERDQFSQMINNEVQSG